MLLLLTAFLSTELERKKKRYELVNKLKKGKKIMKLTIGLRSLFSQRELPLTTSPLSTSKEDLFQDS